MHKNSLSTFLIFVTVAIVFLIGGYAAGAGYLTNQSGSIYGSPAVAQKASWDCQKNSTDPKCNPTIAKPMDLGTTGPMGGDTAALKMGGSLTPVPAGFYYRSVNDGQGCLIVSSKDTDKGIWINVPCPFSATASPDAKAK